MAANAESEEEFEAITCKCQVFGGSRRHILWLNEDQGDAWSPLIIASWTRFH